MCVHASFPILFWCILDTYLKVVPRFVRIRVNLAEILRCVTLPKLCASSRTLYSVHKRTLLINAGEESENTLKVS